MPALFAYILSLTMFLGGGYFGLSFVAGNFDNDRSSHISKDASSISTIISASPNSYATSTPLDGTFAVDSNNAKLVSSVEPSSTTPLTQNGPRITDELYASQSPASQLNVQNIQSQNSYHTSKHASQIGDISSPEQSSIPQAAMQFKSNTEEQSLDRTETASVDPATTIVTPNEADRVRAPNEAQPKSKTSQTVKNATFDLRLAATDTSVPISERPKKKNIRISRRKKPDLKLMVLQTIEFSDGRREQRLVSRREARTF